MSKKSVIGAVFSVVLVGTRFGRDQLGKVLGTVQRRLGGEASDPFAVAPSEEDAALATGATAAELAPEVRQDLAAELPPTPGTVAVAVGAPNAPDLDVIAGDHDLEHRSTD